MTDAITAKEIIVTDLPPHTSPRPSLGRIVHYYPDPQLDRHLFRPGVKGSPLRAAIITDVYEGGGGEHDVVSLNVFDPQKGALALDRCVVEGVEPGTWRWPARVG